MTVRLGINPIGWINDDIRWLGDEISLESCLSEARAAGFSGIELGRKFPRRTEVLRPILERHGLALVSGWYSARLLERSVADEIALMRDHLELLVAMGCQTMIYAETTGEIVGRVSDGLSKRPKIEGTAAWREFGRKTTEIAEHMRALGLRLAFHHHMGTVIQSAEDIDRLLENTGEAVGLLLDTGHLIFGGGDLGAGARRWAKRIAHVHCKDVRRVALQAAREQDTSFAQAVISGTFTVPGDGIIDFSGMAASLAASDYRGWIVNEAEQDPRLAPPAIYARMGCRYLTEMCAAAGLAIAAP
jgi:inosose dehydratase